MAGTIAGSAGAIAVAGPCWWLAVHRGGASAAGQTAAYVAVFALLAACMAIASRRAITVRLPLVCWLALAWPLVGLAPLPRALLERLDPQRAAELAAFARAGIAGSPAISLYPYATARAWWVLAGSVALFVLARELGGHSVSALRWLSGAILVMALAEALPAVRQYAALAMGAARSSEPGADFIRGTFANRNLLAAWLEGCYGVALAWFASGMARPSFHGAGAPPAGGEPEDAGVERFPALRVLAGVAALGSAVAIVCSFSRMGTATLAVETALVAWLLGRGQRRARLARAALVLGAVAIILVAGVPDLANRYSSASLAAEKQGRVAIWADSIHAAARYPWLGSGAGTFAFAFRRSHSYLSDYTIDHAHCEYLETAVEWGIPATVLLGLAVAAGLWRWARAAKKAAGFRRAIGAGCLAGVCAVLLHGLVDFPLRSPAILALVAVLAGIGAAALAAPPEPRGARWRSAVIAAGAVACAVLVVLGWPGCKNAETDYQDGRRSFLAGRFAEAAAADRLALAACPYAAAAWSDLALAAEAQGHRAAALEAANWALALEPGSRRIEWAVANLRMRLGDAAGGWLLLGQLAARTPELRRPVWQIGWDAGTPAVTMSDSTAGWGAGALDEYVQYLASQKRWEAAAKACTRPAGTSQLRPRTLRNLFDGLFFAGRLELALRVWKTLSGCGGVFKNGDLALPLRGWGLDWVARPVNGVVVERRPDGTGYRLDIEFEPANIEYVGVTHDFTVMPAREYRLALEAQATDMTSSSGVQVEVISPRRRLAASEPFLRSTPWTRVELRFRPAEGERICRMRVFRAAASGFDTRLGGRFSLRRVSLMLLE